MISHELELNFGNITLLFSIAPFSSVQMENNMVMFLYFHLDLWLIINSCSVGHSLVDLEPLLSYRYRIVVSS
jgi:hypothetical protein